MTERAMADYTVTPHTGEPFTVRAETIAEAATIGARKLHSWRVSAMQTTGTTGKSGYFQAMTPLGQGMTSVGEPFHVG